MRGSLLPSQRYAILSVGSTGGIGVKRREFITLIGGAAAAGWPLAARAQQTAKLPTVGFLGSNASAWSPWTAAFVQRLRELGWIEDRTIAITYRWSEGRPERIAEIAAEFVRLKVDVIVSNAIAVPTLMQATEVIPIVFALGLDPVGAGVVASLARPGGNVTGLSSQSADLASKRLELLREVLPRLRRLAIIGNVDFPQGVLEMAEVQAVARGLGIEVAPLEIRRAEDIAPAFEALKAQADALYIVGDALVNANRTRIMTFSLSARLPTIFNDRSFVQAGGLMSYGPNFSDLFRRTAELVDKVLRGTKPGDIPVEQPSRFELVINLTTAKAIDLTLPESFLLRADEVIE
jgi:putative tryptophan/tyrosine transport system substrate-binding protein